jgi:hypothetical protein
VTESTVLTTPQLSSRTLVDDRLWNRLVTRIVLENGMDHAYAERVMDQALGFLLLCAMDPTNNYRPSAMVDIGWHTFLLYTKDYAAFCQRVAGYFIHHVPDDEPTETSAESGPDTAGAMVAAGIFVDAELWATAAECGGHKCYTCTVDGRS